MAWGLFNKIKKGFKKVGSVFKKGAQFVNDKIVQPFKPYIKAAANAIIPGAGRIVDVASDGLDAVTRGDYRGAVDSGKNIYQFASDIYRQKKK